MKTIFQHMDGMSHRDRSRITWKQTTSWCVASSYFIKFKHFKQSHTFTSCMTHIHMTDQHTYLSGVYQPIVQVSWSLWYHTRWFHSAHRAPILCEKLLIKNAPTLELYITQPNLYVLRGQKCFLIFITSDLQNA